MPEPSNGHAAGAALGPELRERLVGQLRQSLVDQGASLPLQSQAALSRVISLCSDTSASARGIALEAARDEGFSALLLRVANSAHSMSAARIGDLTQAVARLGFSFVQGLAIASMAAPGFGHGLESTGDDAIAGALRELHRHSVRVGLIARAIAPAGVSAEIALTAGLLHNLGLSVIAIFAPRAFHHLLHATERGEQLTHVEQTALGFTHGDLGARLAQRWSFAPHLVRAIGEHDAAEPSDRLAAIVQVADLLVRGAGVGIEAPREIPDWVITVARVDINGARERTGPLLEAQDRLDARMAQELEAVAAPGA